MHILAQFLRKFYSQIGTSLAKEALAHLASGDWKSLQTLEIPHPSMYNDPLSYKKDVMVRDILRKARLPLQGFAESRVRQAVTTFWVSEAQCCETNTRLARYMDNRLFLEDPSHVAVHDFINRWRKEVARVLGACPGILEPRFSTGSTLSDKGFLTTIPDKMSSKPTSYSQTLNHYEDFFSRTPQGEAHASPELVRGNKFFTVPKDSFKDRGCCVEASVNIALQLHVGKVMKDRYSRAYGVRLQDQKPVHMALAKQASCDGSLATIDLSNASDTVARTLVELLVPPRWLTLLKSLRATHTFVDGRWVRLEKFSSMGNGFTFELETIIFQTLADTIIGERKSSCFGDDIIMPTQHARDMIAALKFFGFTPNDKKTFCEGPFRESCGGDYFHGVEVRPHYLDVPPDEPQHWISLANGLRRVDPTLRWCSAAWFFCLDQIPAEIRKCRGPSRLGDVVIHDPDAPWKVRSYHTVTNGVKHANTPIPFYRAYVPVKRNIRLSQHFSYRVATAAASLGVPELLSGRDQVSGYRITWVPAWGRADLYDWIGA